MEHPTHSISFAILEPSALRVYVEPHRVDIDVWLYFMLPDGTRKTVDYAVSMGEEETIFHVLQPGPYVLVFLYYNWEPAMVEWCNSFNLDLAIAPIAHIRRVAAEVSQECRQTNLPQIRNTPDDPYLIPSSGFKYGTLDASKEDYHVYCVLATEHADPKERNFFWQFTFTV